MINKMVFIYIMLCPFSGYISSRLFKSFHGISWILNASFNASAYPVIIFGFLFFINILQEVEGTLSWIYFWKEFNILLLWLLCAEPLVILGSFIGRKQNILKYPQTINVIPSIVPEQPKIMNIICIIIFAGMIPFA
jgi:transmembrane 9 superfamily protein 2/4